MFLLGDLLLRTTMKWFSGDEGTLAAHIGRLPPAEDCGGHFQEDLLRSWATASLLHDIGYHFQGLTQGTADEWKSFFNLSSGAVDSPLEPQQEDDPVVFCNSLATRLRGVGRRKPLDAALPQEPGKTYVRNHGLLSALRIAQVAAHADSQDERIAAESRRLLPQVAAAVHAVALHDLPGQRVQFSTSPLACLLRFCDEIQDWERVRVNTERMVKNLYLDIVETRAVARGTSHWHEMLDRVHANIDFEPGTHEATSRTSNKEADLRFELYYNDPSVAQFDTSLAVLSKAFNLQHLSLTTDDLDGHREASWSVDLCFPSPREYGDLSEYDILGLFAEETRLVPLLHEVHGEPTAEGAGLVMVAPPEKPGRYRDHFRIVLARRAQQHHRHGWIPAPLAGSLVDRFLAFKKKLLASRNRGW